MTRAEKLREAIVDAFLIEDELPSVAVARAIVDELGITRDHLQAIRIASDALDNVREHPTMAIRTRRKECVGKAREAADAWSTLLDAAGACDG